MSIIKKIGLILYSLLFSLLLAELMFRLIPNWRLKYEPSRYLVKKKVDVNRVEALNSQFFESVHHLYRPSKIPGLGYELAMV